MLDIKEISLTNGMKAVMCRKRGMPVITVNSAFHAGSKDESPDKTGLSHLMEHLLFTGTANITEGKFDEILYANGGESNAFTTNDYTSYYLSLPSSKLELGLWLDSDKLTGFAADEDSLEIQKDVVLEERLQVHDNSPYGSIEEVSSRRLFPNTGYRWNIIGSAEHIKSFTLNDVKAYYDKFYRPSNAIITVVGDIEYGETENLIRKYYDSISDSGVGRIKKDYTEKPDIESGEEIISDNVSLAARFIFYKAPKAGSAEYYALKVLSSVLSAGDSSRLQRRLMQERNYANEIFSYVSGMEFASFLSLNCFCNEDISTDDAGNEIDRILDDILNGGLTDNEIEKAKNKIKTSYILKLQSIMQVSDKLTYFGLLRGGSSLVNNEIEKFDEIKKSDLLKTAIEYLHNDNRVVLNYLPLK